MYVIMFRVSSWNFDMSNKLSFNRWYYIMFTLCTYLNCIFIVIFNFDFHCNSVSHSLLFLFVTYFPDIACAPWVPTNDTNVYYSMLSKSLVIFSSVLTLKFWSTEVLAYGTAPVGLDWSNRFILTSIWWLVDLNFSMEDLKSCFPYNSLLKKIE